MKDALIHGAAGQILKLFLLVLRHDPALAAIMALKSGPVVARRLAMGRRHGGSGDRSQGDSRLTRFVVGEPSPFP